ncbi:hypothetical protein E7T09_00975 [Deinococcus sp. KSM4-11]|uniref:RCC1 domain-containing protein n=1 Tax=Deinococcus sp. KSM4-11 TaxID=2568654 RepID=UPI0010A38B93|nr:hypothetical protein [Deinococcus sp. KSM4-11]THF87841.1 hypothetical protein E7T09_00975 [Deinococcus sp. KSM4-11]
MTVPRRLLLAGLLALSACSQPTAPQAASPTATTTPTIGTPGPEQSLVRLVLPNLKAISGQYLNASKTTSLTVAVDSAAPTTIALSSLTCTASGCPVKLYVSAGAHTFTVKAYSATSVLISQGSQGLTVVKGQDNALDMTLDAVNVTYSLRSAVQQFDPATKVIGNYARFRFSGGHSLVAYYDILAKDAVGDTVNHAPADATLCGDSNVRVTNISDATFPNRYRVELTTAGTHTLTAYSGLTCGMGSVLATQSLKTISARDAISGGDSHSLALLADGTVRAWGNNSSGRLGNPSPLDSTTPMTVSGITTSNPAVEVAAGNGHSLAILADGTVRAWGYNGYGQLGNGTTTQSTTPVTVSGITTSNPAVEIAAGYSHSLAILADGTVRAWGYNNVGQLGNGTTTKSTTPVTVSGITASNPAVEVAGGNYHSLAILADGTVRAWGYSNFGQLGNGATTGSTTPVTVSGITASNPAVEIAGGLYHSLAILADGTVRAWGYNSNGQLGNGTTTSSTTPVTVSGITTAAVPTP